MSKQFDLTTLVRPHLLNLVPYSSARDEYTGKEGVFLDANENALGSADELNHNRYPDPYQQEIKQKLARIKNVNPDNIFLPIDLLIRLTCTPGKDAIVIHVPTYGMYEVSANINEVNIIKVPLTDDFQLRVDAMLEAVTPETRIMWVCSPNNPTGNLVKKADLEKLLVSFNGLVVVDEAYIDFASEESWISQLGNFPNLVVLQTFSKAWGLAGLRAGVCYGSPELISLLNKIKPPYNMSTPAQMYLNNALDNVQLKEAMVADILKERERLQNMLQELTLVKKIYPSDANFLLVKFDDGPAVMKHLLEAKVIVRDRSKVILTDNCLRITVGTAEENDLLLASLRKF
jgi:histidinol-phosphate aminotransferase